MKQKPQALSQSQLINAIKSNNSKALQFLYATNYAKLQTLIIKQNGSENHAKTIYQHAFLLFCTHIKTNIFSPDSNSSIENYLYKIGESLWREHLKNDTATNLNTLNIEIGNTLKFNTNLSSKEYQQLQLVMKTFKTLGEPCKQLLKNFLFEKKSLKEMAYKAGIKEAYMAQKKQLCLQRLQVMLTTNA